jgi:uncharacterized protein (DUF362 family)
MSVAKLQGYLDELLAEDKQFDAEVVANFIRLAKGWEWVPLLGGVSEEEWKFLAEKVLARHRDRFADEAARRDLGSFLVQEMKSGSYPGEPFLEFLTAIPGLANLLVEANLGQWWQIFQDGKAPAEVIRRVRQEAQGLGFRGTVSLAKISPQAGSAEIEAALRKAIQAIGGFDFLSRPPAGEAENKHTILIKAGVNWGQIGGYPTVTSSESVYALAKMCLQEAEARGAAVVVIVGDESGIEIKLMGGTTMGNFEFTGILQAAVLAGLERAAALAEREPERFQGAREMLAAVQAGQRVTRTSEAMLEMAARAGVRVVPFDEVEHKLIPIPGSRHFPDGILVPKFVVEEVTDIINLPKPPGRHLIMGNTGLTGALKNHVGLLAGSHRSPGLHGPHDRYPRPAAGQTGSSYLESMKALGAALVADASGKTARKFALDVMFNWDAFAPDLPFHEKMAELYLAFAAKERFSVADMRRTVSSLGPDMGDTIDIGAVLAAKDPLTLDVVAGALLKRAYLNMGEVVAPGGDTLLEYLVGKTWLKDGSPFDLMNHIAANSYGLGPLGLAHIDFLGLEDSGFSPGELAEITSHLRSGP